MNSCTDQVAIVTGATRGIGQALAVRLAAEGAAVAAVGRTLSPIAGAPDGSLQQTIEMIESVGGRGIAIMADVADEHDRRHAVAVATRQLGAPVSILVNNVAAPRAFDLRFDTMTKEAFDAAIAINVWAAWALAQDVVPGMRERGGGWILNISSRQAAPRTGPPYAPNSQGGACLYGGTKAMIDRMTTGAAMDLYDARIAVNALSPESAVMTQLVATMNVSPDSIEPMETFVEAAIALCSGDPSALTGRVCYSLSLLRELNRPVHSLDGRDLVEGWQPHEIPPARMYAGYLR